METTQKAQVTIPPHATWEGEALTWPVGFGKKMRLDASGLTPIERASIAASLLAGESHTLIFTIQNHKQK